MQVHINPRREIIMTVGQSVIKHIDKVEQQFKQASPKKRAQMLGLAR